MKTVHHASDGSFWDAVSLVGRSHDGRPRRVTASAADAGCGPHSAEELADGAV